MAATKPAHPLIVDDAIDIQSLFELNKAPTKDAMEVAAQLSGNQRARIAQFCYARVHMRKLGLNIAATCDLIELQEVFGAGAQTIFNQSRDVENTLSELHKSQWQYIKKPVSLRVIKASQEN